MAYNFLGLVNKVCNRVNEVELNSTTFPVAKGFYNDAKNSVNNSIRDINYLEYEWPFNHVTQETTLVPGQVRYPYPADAKTIDMDSFRIKRSSVLNNETKKLSLLSYEDYMEHHLDKEYDTTNTGIRTIPTAVFRTPDLKFGLIPPADQAYTVVYEYYRLPIDLVDSTDVPSIPEQFSHVIIEGAMYYVYLFRGNTQDAAISKERFEEGLKSMRSLYINRYEYLRDHMIVRGTPQSENYVRVI